MAASTIPNSAGPGSSVELSPVTIAVRDKVIEKFADQPLDEMNESVKALLSKEEDEQKRLGILAARTPESWPHALLTALTTAVKRGWRRLSQDGGG